MGGEQRGKRWFGPSERRYMVDSAKGETATRGARSVRYTSGFLGRRLHVYVARERVE